MTIQLSHNTLSPEQWQSAAKAAGFYALQQDWGYGAAAEDMGAKVSRIAIYDGEQLIGLAQMMHKKWLHLVPSSLCMRGPIWLCPLTLEQKTEAYRLLRKQQFYSLFMPEATDDAEALKQAGARRVMTGYHTAMLDLTADMDALRANLDAKWRNKLKLSEQSGLQIKRLIQPTDYQYVLQAEAEQSAKVGYSALHPMMIPLYQIQLGDGAVLALEARHEHTPIAAIICLIHGASATYHIGWSSEEGKRLRAHTRLLWQAIKLLKQRDIQMLDLGGINTDHSAGIARFKIGTDGKVISLAGTYF